MLFPIWHFHIKGVSNSPLMAEIERIGPDSPIIQIKTPDHSPASSISSQKFLPHNDSKYFKFLK